MDAIDYLSEGSGTRENYLNENMEAHYGFETPSDGQIYSLFYIPGF